MEYNAERELGWDDTIQNDSEDYTPLPAGDYDFEVLSFERGRHAGSEKLPPCNKAVLNIKLINPERSITISHNLFLHTKTEGLLCAFFRAIGQRQKGEELSMNWSTVVGSRGRCKVDVRTYTGNDGNKYTSNNITRFYDAEPTTGGYTSGRF